MSGYKQMSNIWFLNRYWAGKTICFLCILAVFEHFNLEIYPSEPKKKKKEETWENVPSPI